MLLSKEAKGRCKFTNNIVNLIANLMMIKKTCSLKSALRTKCLKQLLVIKNLQYYQMRNML